MSLGGACDSDVFPPCIHPLHSWSGMLSYASEDANAQVVDVSGALLSFKLLPVTWVDTVWGKQICDDVPVITKVSHCERKCLITLYNSCHILKYEGMHKYSMIY